MGLLLLNTDDGYINISKEAIFSKEILSSVLSSTSFSLSNSYFDSNFFLINYWATYFPTFELSETNINLEILSSLTLNKNIPTEWGGILEIDKYGVINFDIQKYLTLNKSFSFEELLMLIQQSGIIINTGYFASTYFNNLYWTEYFPEYTLELDLINISDILGPVKSENESPVEWEDIIVFDKNFIIPTEWGGIVYFDNNFAVPFESNKGISLNALASYEKLSQVTDQVVTPFSSSTSLSLNRQISYEELLELSTQNVIPYGSSVGITVNKQTLFEELLSVDKQRTVPIESLTTVSFNEHIPFEALFYTLKQNEISFEWTGTLTLFDKNYAIPVEWRGEVVYDKNFTISVESLKNTTVNKNISFEELTNLIVAGIIPFDSLRTTVFLNKDFIVPIETLITMSNEQVAEYESLLGIIESGIIPFDYDGIILFNGTMYLRNLKVLTNKLKNIKIIQ